MPSLSVPRLLLRSILRSSRRYHKECSRVSKFTSTPLDYSVFWERKKHFLPDITNIEMGNTANLHQLVIQQFRTNKSLTANENVESMNAEGKSKLEKSLDIAFEGLRLLNDRIDALSDMIETPTSEATTNNVKVTVNSTYAGKKDNYFEWVYNITIANQSNSTVKLDSRFWRLKSLAGKKWEITGSGVAGKQPILNPGESHSYSSTCKLPSILGVMSGQYLMTNMDNGSSFKVNIAPFALCLKSNPEMQNS